MFVKAFPNELVAEIFRYAHSSRNPANLSLRYRQFYNIAQQFLYRLCTQCSNDGMAALVQTMLERYSLAKYVKHITVFGTGMDEEDFEINTFLFLITERNRSYIRQTYLTDIPLGQLFGEKNSYNGVRRAGFGEVFTVLQLRVFSESLESISFPARHISTFNSYTNNVLERAGKL